MKDQDLQALVEACLDDGMNFSQILKTVREEWYSDIRTAADRTAYGLKLAHKAGHQHAKSTMDAHNEFSSRSYTTDGW